MADELTPAPNGEPASGDTALAPDVVVGRALSPRQLVILRGAIVVAILLALLAAGGGVDAAQHTFAHMFPSDVNACGGG